MKDFPAKIYNEIYVKVKALTPREQLILVVLGVILLHIVWQFLLLNTISSHKEQWRIEKRATQSAYLQTSAELEMFQSPEQRKKQSMVEEKIVLLEKDIKKLNQQLAFSYQDSGKANKLTIILKDLIKQQKGLKLVSLSTGPSQAEKSSVFSQTIIKKPITLVIMGDYFKTASYISKIENLPWPIVFGALYYHTHKYPNAETTLKINLVGWKK